MPADLPDSEFVTTADRARYAAMVKTTDDRRAATLAGYTATVRPTYDLTKITADTTRWELRRMSRDVLAAEIARIESTSPRYAVRGVIKPVKAHHVARTKKMSDLIWRANGAKLSLGPGKPDHDPHAGERQMLFVHARQKALESAYGGDADWSCEPVAPPTVLVVTEKDCT